MTPHTPPSRHPRPATSIAAILLLLVLTLAAVHAAPTGSGVPGVDESPPRIQDGSDAHPATRTVHRLQATVTDTTGVDDVRVRYVFTNATGSPVQPARNVSLATALGSDTYRLDVAVPRTAHHLTYAWSATDNLGQANHTANTTLRVADTLPPTLTDATDPTPATGSTTVVAVAAADNRHVRNVTGSVQVQRAHHPTTHAAPTLQGANGTWHAPLDLPGDATGFTVAFHATDTAGNTATLTVHRNVTDAHPPTIHDAVLPTPYLQGAVAVHANVTDNHGVTRVHLTPGNLTLQPNGSTWHGLLNTTRLPDGPTTLAFHATDGDHTTTTRRNATVDNTPPTTHLSAPAGWVNHSVNLQATSTDAVSGVDQVLHRIHPGNFTGGTSIHLATDGVWHVEAVAVDHAGNQGVPANATVRIDTTPPDVSLDAGAATTGDALTVQGNVTDALSGLHATGLAAHLDDHPVPVTWNASNQFGTVPLPADHVGLLTVNLTVVDAAGNLRVTTLTRTVTDDDAPGNVTLTAPTGYVTGPIHLTATATDNVAVDRVVFLHGTTPLGTDATASDGWNLTVDAAHLPTGNVTLRAVAFDAAGHATASTTVHRVVDHAAPTLNLSAPRGWTGTAPVTVPVAAADDAAGVATLRTWTTPPNTSLGNATSHDGTHVDLTVPEGVWNVTVEATDHAGRTTTRSVTVRSDATPPNVSIARPRNGSLHATTPGLAFTALDTHLAHVTCRLDTTPVPCRNGSLPQLATGDHTLTVEATDQAGHTRTAAASFRVDLHAPTLDVSGPTEVTEGRKLRLDVTAQDATGVTSLWLEHEGTVLATYDAAGNTTAKAAWTLTAPSVTTWNLTVHAGDLAGHTRTTTWNLTVHEAPEPTTEPAEQEEDARSVPRQLTGYASPEPTDAGTRYQVTLGADGARPLVLRATDGAFRLHVESPREGSTVLRVTASHAGSTPDQPTLLPGSPFHVEVLTPAGDPVPVSRAWIRLPAPDNATALVHGTGWTAADTTRTPGGWLHVPLTVPTRFALVQPSTAEPDPPTLPPVTPEVTRSDDATTVRWTLQGHAVDGSIASPDGNLTLTFPGAHPDQVAVTRTPLAPSDLPGFGAPATYLHVEHLTEPAELRYRLPAPPDLPRDQAAEHLLVLRADGDAWTLQDARVTASGDALVATTELSGSTRLAYVVDTSVPTVSVSTMPVNLTEPVEVHVDAADDVAVDSVTLHLDGSPVQPTAPGVFTLDPGTLYEGTHEVEVVATDLAGRTASTSWTFDHQRNTIAPPADTGNGTANALDRIPRDTPVPPLLGVLALLGAALVVRRRGEDDS